MRSGFTYILSNFNRTAFYIGSTNDIENRLLEHRYLNGAVFTTKYKCYYLVYLEDYQNIQDAVDREKQLKNWRRDWKIKLIKEANPTMENIADDWYTEEEIKSFKKANNIK